MAEAFGVAAGAAGFVSLLIQINNGINTLRSIRKSAEKAPAELDALMRELYFLADLMQAANEKAPSNNTAALELCRASCDQVIKDLEVLIQNLPTDSVDGRKRKLPMVLFAFKNWKEDFEAIQRGIQAAKINLILAKLSFTLDTTYRMSRLLDEMGLVNQLHGSASTAALLTKNIETPQTVPTHTSAIIKTPPTSIRRPKPRSSKDCVSNFCSCACHQKTTISRRFWALEYTPLAIFQQACDKQSCNFAKYGVSLRLALSQFGIRWSTAIQFHLLSASGKLSLRPVLEVERIVRYTSPGFEAIWRCEHGLISLEEARRSLVNLRQTDRTFPNHVNPGGRSYIEELVAVPWWGFRRQFALLELFMRDFSMTQGTRHPSFLSRCARWIGEGPHLTLLDVLVDLGFDATEIDALNWPQPCSPGWISEKSTPDPFFVEYLSTLCQDNQGFAAMTPLHEAILFGSHDSVSIWISRSVPNERNDLGQTPCHLAISRPQYLDALIQSGHDLNALDNYGIAPLMYAAATNQEESLMVLLTAGADLRIRDTRYGRNFMHYAAVRQHWKLILSALRKIEDLKGQQVSQSWAKLATLLFQVRNRYSLGSRGVTLQQLLAKCGSINFTYNVVGESENNCLLHHARSVADLMALLDNGFELFNHVNSAGQHPLMAAVGRSEPTLVSKLLDIGGHIDLKDIRQHTSLYYALGQWQTCGNIKTWLAMDIARILLINGANVLCTDNCRCSCSPDGCSPSSVLRNSAYSEYSPVNIPIQSLEWVILLQEHRGDSAAKTVLLSFIRRAKHAELGMTHVCCMEPRLLSLGGVPTRRNPVPDDDIDDIIDEESEFVEILEREMNESTNKPFDELFHDWICQIKTSMVKLCQEENEENERRGVQMKQDLEVNYKADCFETHCDMYYQRQLDGRVKLSIAEYTLWVENEYRRGHTSLLEEPVRQGWYLRRCFWLHRIIGVLDLSATEIASEARRQRSRFDVEIYDHAAHSEGDIQHFLASMDRCEEESTTAETKNRSECVISVSRRTS